MQLFNSRPKTEPSGISSVRLPAQEVFSCTTAPFSKRIKAKAASSTSKTGVLHEVLEVLENRCRDRDGPRCSHQIPSGIQRVDADVDKRPPPGALLVRKPTAETGRNATRTHPDGFGKINSPEFFPRDQIAGQLRIAGVKRNCRPKK